MAEIGADAIIAHFVAKFKIKRPSSGRSSGRGPCGRDGIGVTEPNFEEGGGRSSAKGSLTICSFSGIRLMLVMMSRP
jgi:hypothetical protein